MKSEEQIELWVEQAIDKLDDKYLKGFVGTTEYKKSMLEISAAADEMYKNSTNYSYGSRKSNQTQQRETQALSRFKTI